MSDLQAQTKDECLSTWCTGEAGHEGPHDDKRVPCTATIGCIKVDKHKSKCTVLG
jgi:hypothetical protein